MSLPPSEPERGTDYEADLKLLIDSVRTAPSLSDVDSFHHGLSLVPCLMLVGADVSLDGSRLVKAGELLQDSIPSQCFTLARLNACNWLCRLTDAQTAELAVGFGRASQTQSTRAAEQSTHVDVPAHAPPGQRPIAPLDSAGHSGTWATGGFAGEIMRVGTAVYASVHASRAQLLCNTGRLDNLTADEAMAAGRKLSAALMRDPGPSAATSNVAASDGESAGAARYGHMLSAALAVISDVNASSLGRPPQQDEWTDEMRAVFARLARKRSGSHTQDVGTLLAEYFRLSG
ncbi:hypothetical protein Q5752_002041 [Cryptotrichosporon argae]